MNNLPTEILQKIFLQLHQQDKFECMTVCRAWKLVIEGYVLFDTVYLHNKRQIDHLRLKNQQDPNSCKKMGRLIIDSARLIEDDIAFLLFKISNLRELDCSSKYAYPKRRPVSPDWPCPWSKTIRKIKELGESWITCTILAADVCPILTDISIQGNNKIPRKNIIRLLVNSPNLKLLQLRSFKLSLTDLELLHNNVPSLLSLSIYSGIIDCSTLPAEIHPSACMNRLEINSVYVESNTGSKNLKQYLTVKYPKINVIVYSVCTRDSSRRILEPNLNLPIKCTGHPLVSLNLYYYSGFTNRISVLHATDSQIENFGSISLERLKLGQLFQSVDAIQSLSLTYIPNNNFINYLFALPLLTELNLYYDLEFYIYAKVEIAINYLLECVSGSLITLRLYQATIVFESQVTRTYPNLKNLTIENCDYQTGLDHFISTAFPNIRRLVIDNTCSNLSAFHFRNLNLSYLEMRCHLKKYNPYILVVTASNNEKRWYTTRLSVVRTNTFDADPIAFPAVKSIPFNKYSGAPFMTITCNSLYHFFLVDLSNRK